MWKCGNDQVGKTFAEASFTGHQNEKNFVGLATDGEYIACGSEDNSLYLYYKGKLENLGYFWSGFFRLTATTNPISVWCDANNFTRSIWTRWRGLLRILVRSCMASQIKHTACSQLSRHDQTSHTEITEKLAYLYCDLNLFFFSVSWHIHWIQLVH